MENIIINDNLKKESRMYYGFMVISFIVIGMQIIALIANFIATGKINIFLKTFKRSKMGSFNLTIKNRKKKIVIYTRYSDVLNKFFQEKNIKLQITK